MSIIDILKGKTSSEIIKEFEVADDVFDEYLGEHGQRKRFVKACNKLSNNDLNIIQTALKDSSFSEENQTLTNEINSPSRVADAILMLEEELETTHNMNILMLLLKAVKYNKVLISLNRARFLYWEEPLLDNNHLPAEFIEFLWESNKNKRYKDKDLIDIVRVISKHPNCPITVLKDLFNVNDSSVRKAVAKHPNIDESLTNIYINSKRMSDREQIANSKYVSEEVLLSLMNDEHDKVIDMAKKQFKKRFPKKRVTKEAIKRAVSERSIKAFKKRTKPKRKFDALHDGRMGVEHVISLNPSQRTSVVKSGSLTKKETNIIEALTNDKSISVRREVAAHYLCPAEILKEYLNDSDFIIVTNAICEITRREPDTIFEDLVNNKEVDFSYVLLNTHINDKDSVPLFHAKDKFGIQKASEVKRVMHVARYTNNPLIQMRIIQDLKRIPTSSRMRWNLLKNLRYNNHLIDSVVRKIAIDLGFGSFELLKSYNNRELVIEYLSQDDISNNDRRNFECLLNTF